MTAVPQLKRIGEETRNPQTPLEVLTNFEIIVERERLLRGTYMLVLEDDGFGFGAGSVPERGAHELKEAGAMCGGARACAMGSMSLAYGISPTDWPGSSTFNEMCRETVSHPALAACMKAMDEAAIEYAAENDVEIVDYAAEHETLYSAPWRGADHALETLFESSLDTIMKLPHYSGPRTVLAYDVDLESLGMTGVILEVCRRAREKLEEDAA